MAQVYVIDGDNQIGHGPFETKQEAAALVAETEVSADSLVVCFDDGGIVATVEPLDCLDEGAP